MSFSAKQLQALRRNLNSRHVRTRAVNGRELSYIEGWYAISEANRIFGFDAWNRETVESRCVLARENRGSFLAVYVARVRTWRLLRLRRSACSCFAEKLIIVSSRSRRVPDWRGRRL